MLCETLPRLEADEYPAFKNVNDENSFYIVKKELKNLIEKIIFCTASEDNRPTLKGCSIEISDNKIIGVASDGYRLAYCKKEIEYGGADNRPRKKYERNFKTS